MDEFKGKRLRTNDTAERASTEVCAREELDLVVLLDLGHGRRLFVSVGATAELICVLSRG